MASVSSSSEQAFEIQISIEKAYQEQMISIQSSLAEINVKISQVQVDRADSIVINRLLEEKQTVLTKLTNIMNEYVEVSKKSSAVLLSRLA